MTLHWMAQALPWPFFAHGTGDSEIIHLGREPGSVMLSANQVMLMDDNDVIVLGSIKVGTVDFLADAAPMSALLASALAVSEAFASIEAPADTAAIPDFFASMHSAIHMVETAMGSDGTVLTSATLVETTATLTSTTTTVVGPAIEGIYVDGALTTTAPSLFDLLPHQLQEAVTEPEPSTGPVLTIDPNDVTMTVESGANMVVNEAIIVNAGLSATFMAVVGDYHSINVIIQTNVYSDNDMIDTRLPGSAANSADVTNALNVAVFASELRDNAAVMAEKHPGTMPLHWQVSVVEGDLVFLDWITQYSFTTDSDTHVLTAIGTTTTITSGENLGLNSVSFENLGHYYDLIIVGGSLYDGNFIIQTNVLYDNDMLAMLSGAIEDGSVSTGGNLLWNSASILNIGAGNVSSGLPDAFSQAASLLGAGDYSMPDGVAQNGMFEGFAGLRVLYVAGNLYDLQSIQQVNVMGDADLVALYEDELLADAASPDWSISTGSNALLNLATIVDYDSVGSDVHVGGQIYSDAILIQADLMAGSDAAPVGDDALVNEVIAFLDIDFVDPGPTEADHSIVPMSDGPSVDVMQSVLA
ncbi:hypothetical protein [Devosia aurantiaca]|uniref:Type I secretion protein n=1 Tax=Devosia aurantiaca TaxID=2714858 RepID=A0A6M1SEW4_9HYPH|nr:hypothetical protein [Devosia aurantiaca]NGP18399.1 hypothetical protein [Devosia aurantiaca]